MSSTPATIGPYNIDERLGRGGMGVVYRAHHRTEDRGVALKTVQLADPELHTSIRREIRALSRLRHPGIVRILDEGVEEGRPWYAMELVDGPTLRAWLQPEAMCRTVRIEDETASPPWWTMTLEARPAAQSEDAGPTSRRPVDLMPRLSLVRRICDALAYLHGEGLVHRDLKPDNILIRGEEQPVLVDFGLTLHFGGEILREVLEVEGDVTGTVAYMAPEQAEGELVDARADIYALGCILYEMVTGKTPFFGRSPMEVLRARVATDPPPPRDLNPSIPPELDALIRRLLARDPRRRLGYAQDVSSALGRLGAAGGDALDGEGPRPRAYLYRPGFTGRSRALSRITAHFQELDASSGGIVLVGGESGLGKTRLAMAVGAQAAALRLPVFVGECLPVGPGSAESAGGGPLHPLRRLLQTVADICQGEGPEETRRLLGDRGRVLRRFEPSLGSLPGQEEAAEKLPPQTDLRRVLSYLVETLRRLAERRPSLLLLDDLQWADDLTLDLLHHLLTSRLLESIPLLVVGTYRVDEVSAPLQRVLTVCPHSIRLGRLSQDEVGDIVSSMLAVEPPPSELVSFVSDQSGGNPFFVGEYLRMVVNQGVLTRSDSAAWVLPREGARALISERLPLPGAIRDVVSRRLEVLPAPARRLVEAAAVLGREIDGGVLEAISGLPVEEFLDALNDTLGRSILDEVAPTHYRFLHDQLRENAYRAVNDGRRRELHHASAAQLSLRGGGQADQLGEIGSHWERAGEARRAQACYLPAARHATQSYAYQKAEELYRAWLRLQIHSSPEEIRVRNELAEKVLQTRGRNEDARDEHRIALEKSLQVAEETAESESRRLLGNTLRVLGRLEEARQQYRLSLEVARRIHDRASECSALMSTAIIDKHMSRMDDARRHYETALAIAREDGDRDREATILGNLAVLHQDQGREAQAQTLFMQALQLDREIGDRFGELMVLVNLARLAQQRGQVDEARPLHQQSLQLSRELGERRTEGIVSMNLAVLEKDQGNLEDARLLYSSSQAILREIGDRRLAAVVLGNMGVLEADEGRHREAEALYEQAIAIHRELDDRYYLGINLANLGSARLERGDPASAGPMLRGSDRDPREPRQSPLRGQRSGLHGVHAPGDGRPRRSSGFLRPGAGAARRHRAPGRGGGKRSLSPRPSSYSRPATPRAPTSWPAEPKRCFGIWESPYPWPTASVDGATRSWRWGSRPAPSWMKRRTSPRDWARGTASSAVDWTGSAAPSRPAKRSESSDGGTSQKTYPRSPIDSRLLHVAQSLELRLELGVDLRRRRGHGGALQFGPPEQRGQVAHQDGSLVGQAPSLAGIGKQVVETNVDDVPIATSVEDELPSPLHQRRVDEVVEVQPGPYPAPADGRIPQRLPFEPFGSHRSGRVQQGGEDVDVLHRLRDDHAGVETTPRDEKRHVQRLGVEVAPVLPAPVVEELLTVVGDQDQERILHLFPPHEGPQIAHPPIEERHFGVVEIRQLPADRSRRGQLTVGQLAQSLLRTGLRVVDPGRQRRPPGRGGIVGAVRLDGVQIGKAWRSRRLSQPLDEGPVDVAGSVGHPPEHPVPVEPLLKPEPITDVGIGEHREGGVAGALQELRKSLGLFGHRIAPPVHPVAGGPDAGEDARDRGPRPGRLRPSRRVERRPAGEAVDVGREGAGSAIAAQAI